MARDPSTRKLAALAVAGAVIVALGIAGAGATYAFLYDGETLGTGENPNVVSAAGNIVTEEVTPDGSANTSSGDCTGNTANDGCDGGSASLAVFGIPVMAAVRDDRDVGVEPGDGN